MTSLEICQHYLQKGKCKYGNECRNSHNIETQAKHTTKHHHLLGPDNASKRKKNFCNHCQKKSKERFRCVEGCDFDLCIFCFNKFGVEKEEVEEITIGI